MKKIALTFVFALAFSSAAAAQQTFVASLTGAQEVPANTSTARGTCRIVLNAAQTQVSVSCTYSGLGTNLTAGHTHGNGVVGVNAGVLFNYNPPTGSTSGTFNAGPFNVTAQQVADMRAHRHYANLHTTGFPGGEIRGQIKQTNTVYDRDGDGRTDITVFRQSSNNFFTLNSLNNQLSSAVLGTGTGDNWLNNTADFDGDGIGDPLLIKLTSNIATWRILQSSNNTIRTVEWGNFGIGDTLAINDYDGDGIQDIAVFRRSNGVWFIIQSSNGQQRVETWGAVNDFPSIGDYDGDGRADLTAVRVESGQRVWYTRNSTNGQMVRTVFGSSATDGVFFFAPIDIDADGRQDIMINRAIGGQRTFFILRSSDGVMVVTAWGLTSDTAMFGDYDGDGRTDFVARRVSSGALIWFVLRSSDGQLQATQWGISPGDQLTDDAPSLIPEEGF